MTPLEIALLIGGALIFAISFIIPSGKATADGDLRGIVEDEVKKTVAAEMDSVKSHIDDVVDEAVDYAQEKTERSLERISNEKIMAVNEYSDTVLEEINKNHKEVMFLYDMLNDKHDTLVGTVGEAEKVESEISGQTAEAKKVLDDSLKVLEESKKNCDEAKEAYDRAQAALEEARQSAENAENAYSGMTANAQAENNEIKIPEISIPAVEENTVLPEKIYIDSVENTVMPENAVSEEAESLAESSAERDAFAETEDLEAEDALMEATSEDTGNYEDIPAQNVYRQEPGKDSEVKVRTLKWAAFAQQQADEALTGNGQSGSNVNIDYPTLPKLSRNLSFSEKENNVNPQAQLHNEVLTLHRLGQSDVEIARSLNMGVGEVSLIIGLHGND